MSRISDLSALQVVEHVRYNGLSRHVGNGCVDADAQFVHRFVYALKHVGVVDGEVGTVDDGHLVVASAVGVPSHRYDATFHAQLIHGLVVSLDGGIVLLLAFVGPTDVGAPHDAILAVDNWYAFVDEARLQTVCHFLHVSLLAVCGIVFGATDVVAFTPIVEHVAPRLVFIHAPEVPWIIEMYLNGEFVANGVGG